jgi:hypothetical protein
MKILFWRYLVACVLLAATSLVFAGEFKSRIITSSPLMVTIPDNHFLKVTNFTQEGGVDRGVLTVTLSNQLIKPVKLVKPPMFSPPAGLIRAPEAIRKIRRKSSIK